MEFEHPFPLETRLIAEEQAKTKETNQHRNKKEINGWIIHTTQKGQLFIPKSLRQEIIEWYHRNLMHPGFTRMYKSMKSIMFWNGMYRDVQRYAKQCDTCMRSKPSFNSGQLPVTESPIVHPWQEISIDYLGPIQGFQILVIMCNASKWLELHATYQNDSKEAAQILDTEWLCRYPKPSVIIHDQGPQFMGKPFRDLLARYGITKRISSAANPQSNAINERVHKTIETMLRTQAPWESGQDWRYLLPVIAYALRATFSTALNASPAQIVFKRDMIHDIVYETNLRELHRLRIERIKKANCRENQYRTKEQYEPGQKVLLKINSTRLPKNAQFSDGPYTIVAIRTNGTVVIDKGAYLETVNIRRLQPLNNQPSQFMGENVLSQVNYLQSKVNYSKQDRSDYPSYFEPSRKNKDKKIR
jgi:Integrase zinc binding domain